MSDGTAVFHGSTDGFCWAGRNGFVGVAPSVTPQRNSDFQRNCMNNS